MPISAYTICAAAGCFKRESGVNPGIWESTIEPPDKWDHVYQYDGIGGYGFGQFTNVPDPYSGTVSWRARDYKRWCDSQGKDPWDGNAQLNYIINVERVWYTESGRMGFQSQADFWNSTSQDLDALVWDWLACWEGVPGDAYAERCEAARRFYDYVYEHQHDDPSSYSWITGNFYTSDSQMLNNVMCMYFYLNGYTPGPGPGPGPDPPGPTPGTHKKSKWIFLMKPQYKRFY